MALVVKDRVKETTTTTGTGTVTLAGATTGFQSFSAIGNGNTTYYTIANETAGEWEVGLGTYTSAGTTLSRDTVLASSNAGSLVSFSAGSKIVFCTYPAGKSVYADSAGNVGLGTASPGAKLAVVGTGYSPNIALSDAATIAWDTSTGQVATFTFVTTSRSMGAPTNLVNGGFYALAVIQNSGGNTLSWNTVFKWAGGTAPTLSTAAGAKDYFTFRSDGTNLYEQGRSMGVA